MNHSGFSLGEFFRAARDRGEPLVLATVARTLGSTYRKAGAQMLLAGDGRAAGLLSGGCLETDLMERARSVLAGSPVVADYDTRSSDDLIWGIGLGCEGAMTILLTRLDRANDYQPFAFVESCRRGGVAGNFALVTQSTNAVYPLGAAFRSDSPAELPAGVAEVAARNCSARSNHRGNQRRDIPDRAGRIAAASARARRGTGCDAAGRNCRIDELARHGARSSSGLRRCRALSACAARRVESCGRADARVAVGALRRGGRHESSPALGSGVSRRARRARVDSLHRICSARRRAARGSCRSSAKNPAALDGRLHGPIGLDIGAKTPEAIALAIVAEIQAVIAGRPELVQPVVSADSRPTLAVAASGPACPSARTPHWRSPVRSAARRARRARPAPRRSG